MSELWPKIKSFVITIVIAVIGLLTVVLGYINGTSDGGSTTTISTTTVDSSTTTVNSTTTVINTSSSSTSTSSATTSSTTVSGTSTIVKILDGLERVEYASASKFMGQVTRRIPKNKTEGFVVSTPDPCGLQIKTSLPYTLFKMVAVPVTTPSFGGGKIGDFYDALVKLSPTNCSGAVYVWLDLFVDDVTPEGTQVVSVGDATINLSVVNITLPNKPSTPFQMGLSNSFVWSGLYGKYVNNAELAIVPFLDQLREHRMSPMYSHAADPGVTSSGVLDVDWLGGKGYRSLVLDYSPDHVFFPILGDVVTKLQGLEKLIKAEGLEGRAYIYTMDEPKSSQMSALITRLNLEKANAPSAKRMVTTKYDAQLDGLVDIFTPVAENFCVETWPGSGVKHPCESAYSKAELWIYVSCMSHSCGVDRGGNISAPKVSGTATGAPDLVIDRSAVESFGLYLLAHKYQSVKGLLYYHAVEQFKLYSRGVDMWTDPFNFGGNGDGTLFYPIRPGVQGNTGYGAATSVRMKLIREASYMSDLLNMNDPAWVKAEADKLMTDPITWDRDLGKFEKLIQDSMSRLLN